MSTKTSIPWCHHTFNPWQGCAKESPGCDHCYAEAIDRRNLHDDVSHWGEDAARRYASSLTWKLPGSWARAAQKAGEVARVFCASMGDVGEDRHDLTLPRAHLVNQIQSCGSWLRWLLLSKRPQNFDRLFRWEGAIPDWVWLGASVEDQVRADERPIWLREQRARVRFLSVEPLLEAVTLPLKGIHWVIVGGESGQAARPCAVEWLEDVVAQCHRAGVAVFVKQLGSRPFFERPRFDGLRGPHKMGKGEDPAHWPPGFGLLNADGSPVRELPADPLAARGQLSLLEGVS